MPPAPFVREVTGEVSVTVNVDGRETTGTTTNARDAAGLPVRAEMNFHGVLYAAGRLHLDGFRAYGSVLSGRGVAGGDGRVFYDAGLGRGDWPPPEIGLPITYTTLWQTDP